MAETALQSGDRALALRTISSARRLFQDPLSLRKLALVYQKAGLYSEEMELLWRLATRSPRDASLLNDLGVCQFRRGLPQESLTTLRQAAQLDPRLLEASLSLGAVYSSLGRKAEALAVYDTALATAASPLDPLLIERLRQARAELLEHRLK